MIYTVRELEAQIELPYVDDVTSLAAATSSRRSERHRPWCTLTIWQVYQQPCCGILWPLDANMSANVKSLCTLIRILNGHYISGQRGTTYVNSRWSYRPLPAGLFARRQSGLWVTRGLAYFCRSNRIVRTDGRTNDFLPGRDIRRHGMTDSLVALTCCCWWCYIIASDPQIRRSATSTSGFKYYIDAVSRGCDCRELRRGLVSQARAKQGACRNARPPGEISDRMSVPGASWQ